VHMPDTAGTADMADTPVTAHMRGMLQRKEPARMRHT
jgi:hypothetical protein